MIIHPTAIVSPKAELGKNIEVGPYAIIEDDVKIGDDCSIGPHAVLYNGARLGNRVKIFQGCSVANFPQDLKFENKQTFFYIGNDTVVREFCTLHRGTSTGFSRVGDNCLLMAYVHVAHDCVVGNNVILVNDVQIGGHVTIEDFVIVGGCTPVHQFCRVGQHAMVGAGLRALVDIPPFSLCAGEPFRFVGLNIVGLRRRGFTPEQILNLKKAYKIIYDSGLNKTQALKELKTKFAGDSIVKNVIDFFSVNKRSIVKK